MAIRQSTNTKLPTISLSLVYLLRESKHYGTLFFKPQKRKVTDTKHKEIVISRLDHLGAGIGHINRKPVFVDGLLPGEKALVQLTEDKKQYARAKVIKRLVDSQARIKPHCPIYDQCGGCNLQHLSHSGQVEAKQQALAELMSKFAATDKELIRQRRLSATIKTIVVVLVLVSSRVTVSCSSVFAKSRARTLSMSSSARCWHCH